MWLTSRSNRKSSSRRQMQIKEFRDDILILPGNEYRLALETSAINFELMSEDEQDVLIDGYQTFLNSLPSAVQILVRVREVDIESYLSSLTQKKEQEKEEVYKKQIDRYGQFIEELVSDSKILSRRFYLILSYRSEKRSIDFQVVKEQLALQKDIISRGLEKLGVQLKLLNTLEFMDLFYSFYNQDQAKSQVLSSQTLKELVQNTYV